jgi:hypothetical protein
MHPVCNIGREVGELWRCCAWERVLYGVSATPIRKTRREMWRRLQSHHCINQAHAISGCRASEMGKRSSITHKTKVVEIATAHARKAEGGCHIWLGAIKGQPWSLYSVMLTAFTTLRNWTLLNSIICLVSCAIIHINVDGDLHSCAAPASPGPAAAGCGLDWCPPTVYSCRLI